MKNIQHKQFIKKLVLFVLSREQYYCINKFTAMRPLKNCQKQKRTKKVDATQLL